MANDFFYNFSNKIDEDESLKLNLDELYNGDNIVYHQFEIRSYNGNFIKKCKEILNYE